MKNRGVHLFSIISGILISIFFFFIFYFLSPNESGGAEYAPTLKYSFAKVVIRVVDAATNRGIAGASVSLGATGYSAAASTNQWGEAVINDIPIPSRAFRNVTVSCSAAGYLSSSRTIAVRDSASTQYFTVALSKSTYESPPSYTIPTEPPAKVTVSGKVYDRATNEPIAMAGVTIAGAGFSQGDSSDNSGRYSISGCPSDKALDVNCRKTGYRIYSARLPILGNISHYHHDIPLDRLISPAPPESDYGMETTEPRPTKELEYIPGVDPRKFKPREEKKEESQFVEKRARVSGGGNLRTPIIADFEGGISAREEDDAVVFFNRSGVFQWKFPEDSQGDYDFNANDISDHGTYIATSGNCVMKFRSDSNQPIWLYPHVVGDCVSISGNGGYVVAGARSGTVYLFAGDEAEQGSSGERAGGRGNRQQQYESEWPQPKNVYAWQLEEGGSFIRKVDISYDGKYIAVGGSKAFYLIDRDTFMSQEEHNGTADCVWSIPVEREIEFISISDDGMYVAANTGPSDGVLYVCSRNSRRPLWSYPFESFHPASSVVSGDGNYVVLGTNKRVYEFSTTGGSSPIWSCKKSDYQTVVDTSYDGKYAYAHCGHIHSQGGGWHDRTYLWDRAYFARNPRTERPFAAYDSEGFSHPWISMSETGDTLVFLDSNRLRVERPAPKLLLDLISGRVYCPELFWQDEQKLRVFITNPGQTVSGAVLRGVLYLPMAQFAESYFALATSAREDENEAATIEDIIGEIAANLDSSTEVFYGYITLAEHSSIDERLEFGIPKLSDMAPIVTWGMTAALLSGRSYTDFDTADLVGWSYTQLTPGTTDAHVYRFVWESEAGAPPVIPPEEPPREEPPEEEHPPGGREPEALNLDLRPVKITFNDGRNEHDATGVRNPRLEAGTTYTVKVDVRNEGPEDLRGVSIPVKITTRPATRELSGSITHIPSGETRPIVYPNVTYDAGSYTFFVLVDSDEVITESGQGQNNNLIRGTATFGVGAPPVQPGAQLPDLQPVGFFIGDGDAMGLRNPVLGAGEQYRMRVSVANLGNADLQGVQVPIDIVTEPPALPLATTIDSISVGETRDAELDVSFGEGSYTFNIAVNQGQVVPESNINNNTATGTATFVAVAGPGAGAGAGAAGAGPAGAGPGAGPPAAPVAGAAQIPGGFRAWLGRLIPQWVGAPAQPVPARPWPQVIPQQKAGREEEEAGIIEKEEGERPLSPAEKFMRSWWILLLVLYIYLSLSLHLIAKKTATKLGWLAWIPIINFYLMCKIARRPGWWFWLLLIPSVNIIIGVIVWMGIATARKKPAWVGVLMLVPLINLIIPGYLAFSR